MRHTTWTVRAIEDGETGRVESGLSHEQAAAAIDRAINGLDPFAADLRPRSIAAATRTERELATPVAA